MGGAWKEFARERLPFVVGSLGLNGLILFLFAIAFGPVQNNCRRLQQCLECGLARSEGFLNGIFHPCALWVRGLTRLESCRQTAVAVGVAWKFRLTCWPRNYIWIFKLDVDSYERYQEFDTGVLHRISSRIYLAE